SSPVPSLKLPRARRKHLRLGTPVVQSAFHRERSQMQKHRCVDPPRGLGLARATYKRPFRQSFRPCFRSGASASSKVSSRSPSQTSLSLTQSPTPSPCHPG